MVTSPNVNEVVRCLLKSLKWIRLGITLRNFSRIPLETVIKLIFAVNFTFTNISQNSMKIYKILKLKRCSKGKYY